MNPQDKALQALLALGDPTVRRSRNELLDGALQTALLLTDGDAAVLTTTSPRRERLVLHGGSMTAGTLQESPEGSEVLRRLAQDCQPIVIANLLDDAQVAACDGCPGVEAGPVLFTPVRRRDGAPSYLAIYRRRGRARFAMSDTRAVLLLCAWLATALEHLRLSTGTEKTTVTDGQTSVYNHRYLKTALRRELRRAGRFGQELSLVAIAVDDFAADGDQAQALKGGPLLQELAAALAREVRSFDIMARHRDDQFMLILPQTGRDGAAEVAERMRAAVEKHSFPLVKPGTITVSMGVASFPRDAADVKGLEAAAGRALQQAQQAGRNCVATPTTRAA